MAPQTPVRGIIFDIGDVLFSWTANTDAAIPPKTLREMMSSHTWCEYECGRLQQNTCYAQIAQEFSVEVSQVAKAFSQARETVQLNRMALALIKDLNKSPLVKVYAMSNMGNEDFAALSELMDWSLFDRVFISGAVGMRKPDHAFFCHVLAEIDIPPEQLVFVDDKRENVFAAESLGLQGVIFDSFTMPKLQASFGGPVSKGYGFLYRNAKQFSSVTDSGIDVPGDNFAPLIILEATQDRNLVDMKLLRSNWEKTPGTWNFFAGRVAGYLLANHVVKDLTKYQTTGEATLIAGGYFPDDLDTTALALTILTPKNPEVVTSVLDEMAEYVNPDGTVLAYFDRAKPRLDPVVSANVLDSFYRFGRGQQLARTVQHLRDVLLHRTYLDGTRYYPSPDCCLGFFTRLLKSSSSDIHLQTTLGSLLKSRVQERVGESGNALDLAMRVIACDSLGIESSVDRKALTRLQCQDGGWEVGWMYRYGSTRVRIGNRGVTTALALKAIAPSVNASPAAAVENDHT